MRISTSLPSEEVVEIAGTPVPTRFSLTYSELTGGLADVTITVRWNGERFIPVHLEIGDRDGDLSIAHTAQTMGPAVDNLARNSAAAFVDVWNLSPDFDAFRGQLQAIHRRRKVTPTRLEQVVEIYLGNPDRPTATVAEKLGISRAHASRLVRNARDAGLLGEVSR